MLADGPEIRSPCFPFDWAAGARCNPGVEYNGHTQQPAVTTRTIETRIIG